MRLPNDHRPYTDEEWKAFATCILLIVCIWAIVQGCYMIVTHWHRPVVRPFPTRLYISGPPGVEKVKVKQKVKQKVKVKKEKPVKNETIAAVIETLCKIESACNPSAIGDGGRAVGILQIWPCMVREASRISGIPFQLSDRYSPAKSREMAWAVLSHYQKTKRVEDPVRLAGLWNRPDGRAPARYLSKFEAEWNKEAP